ncbi:DUF6660 family protein [Dyadobacter endophyticus]
MKGIVAYLLAFYVFALSCIPCQDEAMPLPDSSVAAAVVSGDQDGHQEAIDLCSPFCICACCASVAISAAVAVLPETAVSQLIPPAGFSYLQILYTGDRAGFWQPPQNKA